MYFSKKLRKFLIALALGLSSSFTVLFLTSTDMKFSEWYESLERSLYDFTYKLYFIDFGKNRAVVDAGDGTQQKREIEDRIVVVDIDETALHPDNYGNYFKWPRSHHANVIRNLSRGGAAAIMFDILFKDANFGKRRSEEAVSALEHAMPGTDWEKYGEELRPFFNHDQRMVDAVQESKISIVAATVGRKEDYEHQSRYLPLATQERQEAIRALETGSALPLDDSLNPIMARDPESGMVKYEMENWDLMDNLFPELAQVGTRMGLVNVIPDEDGVHRRERLFHTWPNTSLDSTALTSIYPIVALQTALFVMGKTLADLDFHPGEYLGIGQPFGISRDSTGKLVTSYPHLTWPMIRSLMEHKTDIENLLQGNSGKKIIDIAPQVVVERDSLGNYSVDVMNGTTMSNPMLHAILGLENIPALLTSAREKSVELPGGVTLEFDEEEALFLMMDEEEEEAYLNEYTLRVLQQMKSKLTELKTGDILYLSSNLDIRKLPEGNPVGQKLKTGFIILTDEVIFDLLKTPLKKIEQLQPGEELRFGPDIRIPVGPGYSMLVKYHGRQNKAEGRMVYEQKSYYDVGNNRIDRSYYQGKIFILGSTAAALFDIVSAPHQSDYPGVMLHATMLDNILKNDFMLTLDARTMAWVVLLLGMLVALVATYLSPLYSVLVVTAMGAGYFLLNLVVFDSGMYLGLGKPEITLAASFTLVLAARYFFEEREKRYINETFKQYISPELIDEMVESGVKPELGGKEDFLTAYFTDIASFSTFSEKIGSASRLVELLNEYLTAMTDILTGNHGTLDKYEGDAIIAFFGAPQPLENNAETACRTALAMQDKLNELRNKWAEEGDKWPVIVQQMRMRIGLNSGQIVHGNMGSTMRKNYTMMGDAVNLAARLESGAKQYGVFTMCSLETLEVAGVDKFIHRPIDKVRVVGKNEPVETFELLCLTEDPDPVLQELAKIFTTAKELYQETKWDEAIALFEKCLETEPHHPDREGGCKTTPSHVFIERCIAYKKEPPVPKGEIWDGVYTATSK